MSSWWDISHHDPAPTLAPFLCLNKPTSNQKQMQPRLPFRVKFDTITALKEFNIISFQIGHFQLGVPTKLPRVLLPAQSRWFVPFKATDLNRRVSQSPSPLKLNEEYFRGLPDVQVPLERTQLHADAKRHAFERLTAPLSVFTLWTNSKLAERSSGDASLYLAQCDLSSLPKELQDDLPTPDVASKAGKGDIYASSLWMGIPPTKTPLHKDPNPNLLVQLAGTKRVRMIPPQAGRAVYEHTRRLCAEADGAGQSALSGASMRGEEMMVGLERDILEDFMWDDDSSRIEQDAPVISGLETSLQDGEGVFIPKGWWHSVRGMGERGDGINASVSRSSNHDFTKARHSFNQVNWWFR